MTSNINGYVGYYKRSIADSITTNKIKPLNIIDYTDNSGNDGEILSKYDDGNGTSGIKWIPNTIGSSKWIQNNNNIYNDNSGNVGINTHNPLYQLDVNGSARIGNFSTEYKLQVKTGVGVYAIKYNTNTLFMGGEFTQIDRETYINGILNTTITYDVVNFVALNLNDGTVTTFGSSPSPIGLNGICRAINIDSTGNVYVGGSFTTAQGTSCNRIAKWNGSSWSALGPGLGNNSCYAIAIDSNDDVYVGGDFTNAGDVTNTSRIAKWDGSSWSALGNGISNNTCYAVAVGTGSVIYVGGNFTNAGGVSNANYITQWNGSSWSSLGSYQNSPSPTCYALLFTSNILYAGGSFPTSQGGVSQNYIVRWNGSTWNNLGTGLNQECRALATDGTNIYVGGFFSRAGGITNTNRIAKWTPNTNTWSALSTGIGNNFCYALDVYNNNIFAGGTFTNPYKYLAQFNNGTWDEINLYINDNDILFVNSSNNRIGINTNNPQYTLDVSGYIKSNIIACSYSGFDSIAGGIYIFKTKITDTGMSAGVATDLYNTTTGYFTAPVKGFYMFNCSGIANTDGATLEIHKYSSADGDVTISKITSLANTAISNSCIVELDNNDKIGFVISNMKNDNIDNLHPIFNGYLISPS